MAADVEQSPVAQRRSFPAVVADLAFSMLVPDGFIEPELPEGTLNVDDPTSAMPLTLVSSPVALAMVAVAGRPAYADGCVEQWLRFLCGHFGIELSDVREGFIGREPDAKTGGHRGVLAHGSQVQDGTPLTMELMILEDGGRLVTAHAMAPTELWASYGEAMTAAVRSVRLERPKGQSTPVMFKELVDQATRV